MVEGEDLGGSFRGRQQLFETLPIFLLEADSTVSKWETQPPGSSWEVWWDFSTGGHIIDHSYKTKAGGCDMKCWNSHHAHYFSLTGPPAEKCFGPGTRQL